VSGAEDTVQHVPVGPGVIRSHRHVLDLTLPYKDLQPRIGTFADAMLQAHARSLL
jgi:hypothetical protein